MKRTLLGIVIGISITLLAFWILRDPVPTPTQDAAASLQTGKARAGAQSAAVTQADAGDAMIEPIGKSKPNATDSTMRSASTDSAVSSGEQSATAAEGEPDSMTLLGA